MNQESGVDKIKRKFRENPFVPLGAVVTTVVLIGGMRTFMVGGDSRTQQKYMRARVVAQGATVVAVALGTVLYDKNSVARKWLAENGIVFPGDTATTPPPPTATTST
ncbi:hypothetical protein H257_09137 [Aphanomyces astaci]|uniref:HIG1 domain-containing protein n=1 Tax=Aphanomyces astaci TaxID=112090 RepID=W4GBJ4_APHAT|nr:hypothetical protein H257_09137 [Aphanomyces astaci]ETV76646.1 hypothetical protein H257_09137 [Aphanomyces astaci]RHY94343.1 hypothetical protein DYB35_003315 [Aphanomyces astaci]RHZ03975.1 hypothetical protein DYB37_006379 [Aphanomyces astaci]RQM27393.1 hypothetical protein B5M09_007592 [Aphanomyces astaci]|eukprot:XP_009833558.1 hypothetical protein H257_09137 [Aphanomyces astaci]